MVSLSSLSGSMLSLLALLLAPFVATAAVIERQSSATTVYKFSGAAALENIAVRPNGQLLVTRMDAPEMWTVDPTTKAASKLVTFTQSTSATGITEISPDVFAVVTGNYSNARNTAGSYGIQKVDFTAGSTTPKVSIIKLIPESTMFNGLTTLNNDTVLIGEGKGLVYKLTVSTGAYSVVLQDASMAPPSGSPIPLGIDGVRYYNGSVYFTNIFKNTLSKFPVDATGKATGAVQSIWSNSPGDDLTFGPDGSVYVATNSKNSVVKVDGAGKVSQVATVSSSTAVAFGRTEADKNVLYVTSSSGSVFSVKL